MKKLIVLLFAVVVSSGQLFANNTPEKDTNQKLREQVLSLLEKPEITLLDQEELQAQIEFTLNADGEIVVLSVDTKKHIVKSYIKSRLNYKKTDFQTTESPNRVYRISLRIKQPIGA